MEKAAAQGNSWAAYRLGKLYLEGKMFRKTQKAVAYLTDSAEHWKPVCPVHSWKTVPHWAGRQTGSGGGLGVFL